MNNWMTQHGEVMQQTQAIRPALLAALTDSDLAYRLPGDNLSLGELLVEMGETEQMYINSLKTFTHQWTYGTADRALASSVSGLTAWFSRLDAELDEAINRLTDADLTGKLIDRGGFQPPAGLQLHIYREALLIYYAKLSLYLKALRIPLPGQMRSWIG